MSSVDRAGAGGGVRRASAGAVAMGAALAALFFVGLLFAAGAQDDYAYICGLAFCGFALFIAARFFSRYLP